MFAAAEDEAVRVFAANLRDVLLAAPAGNRATLGLDPGLRTGVKVPVVAVTGNVGAGSVGIIDGLNRLDLDYSEDSRAEVDFNVVGTDAGAYVELQGTAEGKAFSRVQLDALLDLANDGLKTLFDAQAAALAKVRR